MSSFDYGKSILWGFEKNHPLARVLPGCPWRRSSSPNQLPGPGSKTQRNSNNIWSFATTFKTLAIESETQQKTKDTNSDVVQPLPPQTKMGGGVLYIIE